MNVKLLFFQFLFEKYLKQITIKCYSESESSREPYQATEDSAGYDLFAAETKTFLPNSVGTISLDLRWAIPTGFFGKLFPRSGLLMEHSVTTDTGVIDANFRGVIQALLVNLHSEKTFAVRTEDRIAQIVFMEKFNANFGCKGLLGKTKRGNDGFGSMGFSVIKKLKNDSEIESTTSESEQTTAQNSYKMLQLVCEKSNDDLQISSEEATMAVNNEVLFMNQLQLTNSFL